MQIISITILVLSFFAACYFISKEINEVTFLKKVLNQIINKPQITSIEDLIKIKNYLQKNISYNSELKTQKRPLLRHTASEILLSNYGFCGENARVAIKLMLIGGIKSNRIYLFRKKWQHVLIEHKFEKKWYMFDGHFDKNTLFKDIHVTKILSENISKYPNTYPNNPYLDFCRLKIFNKISILTKLSKTRLPSFLVYILESPHIIKALFILIVQLFAILILTYE